MAYSGFKGSAGIDTGRFRDKQKKLLKKMNFPSEFNSRVNMEKISMPVIKRWITERITGILGFEDEVVIHFIFNLLERAKKEKESPDPRDMQISLTGFLERDARVFMGELWSHLVSAQRNPGGIPNKMLEEAKRSLHDQRGSNKRRSSKIETVKTEPVKKKVKKPAKPDPRNEMKENIAKFLKKTSKAPVPKSLADLIPKKEVEPEKPAPIIASKASPPREKPEDPQMNRERAERMAADRERPRRSPPKRDRERDRDIPRDRDRRRLGRDRSRERRKRRSPSISPSPSPPEELMRSGRDKRRRR